MASLISFSALGPYPYPREILSIFLLIPMSSAHFRKSESGSEPADKTKISGVMTDESLKHFDKSNTGAIMNC